MNFIFIDKSYIELREDNTSTTVGKIAHEVRAITNQILREQNIADTYEARKVLFTHCKNEIEHLKEYEVQKLIQA